MSKCGMRSACVSKQPVTIGRNRGRFMKPETRKTRTPICCEPKVRVRVRDRDWNFEQDAEMDVNPNICPGCGIDLAEAPNNCDRDGHLASGLGAVVGFEWWPIKVYRPCPAFEAAGKTYVRKGQITNEILFRKKERSEM